MQETVMTDIPVKEFLLEEISSRLGEPILLNKTDFPLIAICRSSRTAHSSVIFLPPEGHYFAAAGIKYPGIFKGVDEYTRENLVPSDLIYKSFIAWMKEAGIRKDFVPSNFFSPYASWGCYGESGYSAMGKRARTLEWDQKLFSAFVGNEWVEPVINYFNEQQKQFGEKAFILGATSMHLGSGNISNDSWRMAADTYSRSVFPDISEEQKVNDELQLTVQHLEKKERVCIDLPFPNCIKAYPVISWICPGGREKFARERAILRAKLISMSEAPWIYSGVASNLELLKEESEAAKTVFGLDAYGEIVDNIERFLDAMNKRYPVILENPFETCMS